MPEVTTAQAALHSVNATGMPACLLLASLSAAGQSDRLKPRDLPGLKGDRRCVHASHQPYQCSVLDCYRVRRASFFRSIQLAG